MSVSPVPADVLAAAMEAAWPGLPNGMTLEEAERRTRKALVAAYPHITADRPGDARIGALLNLTQGLINKYVELATALGSDIEDEAKRRELNLHVQDVIAEARQAWGDIATAPAPR